MPSCYRRQEKSAAALSLNAKDSSRAQTNHESRTITSKTDKAWPIQPTQRVSFNLRGTRVSSSTRPARRLRTYRPFSPDNPKKNRRRWPPQWQPLWPPGRSGLRWPSGPISPTGLQNFGIASAKSAGHRCTVRNARLGLPSVVMPLTRKLIGKKPKLIGIFTVSFFGATRCLHVARTPGLIG